MTVRKLAWAGFGLWAALTVVGCVFHLIAGDGADAIYAAALGALAWSGALLRDTVEPSHVSLWLRSRR